jgi:alpha-L-rhamnosidase
MNSHNHPMFGSVGSWLYKALGGIALSEEAAGFEKILVHPQMVRDLNYAAASTRTVRGDLACSWYWMDKSIRCEVTIPVGSEAEVRIPKFNLLDVAIAESGTPIWKGDAYLPGRPGIGEVKKIQGGFTITIGSGRYIFELSGN